MSKICIITDAWYPQVNGVVRSIECTIKHLKDYEIEIVHPGLFKNFSCPGYKEIKLTLFPKVDKYINNCDYIHIATEGPIGFAARRYCIKNKLKINTAYHTKFPEYIEEFYKIPAKFTYPFFRWFHNKADSVLVSTEALKSELENKGFNNLKIWRKGVDTNIFKPLNNNSKLDKPVFLNVGRVSHEKNLEAFLKLDLPGSKVIVGDGPAKEELMNKYPEVHFLGVKSGESLVNEYNNADVFVFPSLTDTLGLVNLEAMSCGIPVVAFKQEGLREIIFDGVNGYLADSNEMQKMCIKALDLDKKVCRETALNNDWSVSAKEFIDSLIKK